MKSYLTTHNLKFCAVKGSGHCLLNAFATSLYLGKVATDDLEALTKKLIEQLSKEKDQHEHLGKNITAEVYKYISNSHDSLETANVVLKTLSEIYKVEIIILKEDKKGACEKMTIKPSIPPVMTLHVMRSGHKKEAQTLKDQLLNVKTLPISDKIQDKKKQSKFMPSLCLTNTPEMEDKALIKNRKAAESVRCWWNQRLQLPKRNIESWKTGLSSLSCQKT